MKKTRSVLFFLLFFCGFIQAETLPLEQKINQVLQGFKEDLNIGILVQDAKSGKVMYAKNVDRYFMPASNQKILTALAALQYLGPDFTYQTQLFTDYKKIHNHSLDDNLYLHFSGDPTLSITQLDLLLNSLLQADISNIKGDIIIDTNVFDQMSMSPGTAWDDEEFCWGSPMNAIILNHNCVHAYLKPAEEAGMPAILELPDFPQSIQFINQVLTFPTTAKHCRVRVNRSDPNSYTLNGCIKVGASPQRIERAIANPKENLVAALQSWLAKNQIKWKGKFIFQSFTSDLKPFAMQESQPLKVLIGQMMKESDNTIADSLFKTIGAKFSSKEGSYKNGSRAVRSIISQITPLKIAQTTLIDGSGTSHYDFLTPGQMGLVLQTIFQHPLADLLISSLAVSGVDGTLKDRMKTPALIGKVFAKTGTSTGVSSLSGYLKTKSNRTLMFSIMINGFVGPGIKYKNLEDKLCQILVEAG